ncbi:hypothetical protein WG66_014901 [Moniliophthora roreri]|nr:hypothetical protein WG66_014901 [Moniliophthora roreri]
MATSQLCIAIGKDHPQRQGESPASICQKSNARLVSSSMVSESCASPKIPPFSAISICEHSAGHSPLPDTSPTSSGLPRSPSPSWTDNGTSDTRSEVLRPGTSFQESIGGSGDVIRPIGSDAILQASMRRRYSPFHMQRLSSFVRHQACVEET